MSRTNRLVTIAALVLGCSVSTRGEGNFGDGAANDDGGDGGGGGQEPGDDGGDDGDDGDDGDPGGDGTKFDTPDGEGGPGDEEEGCEKVDFLFVVDNSGSMWDNQQNLANSFPGFIATIQEVLQAQDYHIMVTDSDPWTPASSNANMDTACETYPTCCYEFCGPNSTCSGFDGDTSYGPCPKPPPPPTQCDATLGAGRNLDVDLNECPIEGGKRYMNDYQPDLTSTFSCVAMAGIGGDWNEQPVNASVAAVQDDINGPGGCNEGFLRDDAILVLTVISDANPYSGHLDMDVDVQAWHDALVEAKNGDPEAIVVLGLFEDGHLPDGTCQKGNPHYEEFVRTFGDKGYYGSVCAPDYTNFFLQAVSTIDAACDEFVPPQG